MIVDGIEILSEKIKQSTRSVHLDIHYQSFTTDRVRDCVNILQDFQGKSHVYLHLKKADSFETVIEMPARFAVTACEPLQHRLNELFQAKAVRFV